MIFYSLIALLLFASQAYGQKTCAKINNQAQNCVVTITITGDAPQYIIQRQDGTGGPIVEKTVTAKIVQDTFNDSGKVTHLYKAVGLFPAGEKVPSNTENWTTPAIPITPPGTNRIEITTDKNIQVNRCKNNTCQTKLQAQIDTTVIINGVGR
jgi:hypothetical protein